MNLFEKVLYFFQGEMERPVPFGWFHLLWLFLMILSIVILCLNKNRSEEEKLEKEIEKNLNYKSFVSIDENNIVVNIDSKKHDTAIANKIMRLIQANFDKEMSITIKFQK